ncbi:MAG: branched-chain amino acid ABC transporter permease [Alphaproteobacteria bacterium]
MTNLLLFVEAPALLVQVIVDGVLVGALFALAAYGLALVWGVMNIINIVQGELVLLGGYVALTVIRTGLGPFFAIPVAGAALFVIGWVLYRGVLFRVVDKDLFTSVLATFGLSILIAQLLNQGFGADVRSIDSGLGTWLLFDGVVTIAKIRVVAFALAIAIGAILVMFLRYTRLGRAIRATAQNARAARTLGIDTDQVYAWTYAINAAICGASGALIVMIWVIQPFGGLLYTVRAFMIVIVAGLGNVAGVIGAALGLGAAETFVGFVLGTQFQSAFVFSLLVIILVIRNLRLARQRQYLR